MLRSAMVVGQTTAREMRTILNMVPDEAEIVVYADVQGEVDCPFPAVDPRAYVCGYFAVEDVCVHADVTVMRMGEALPL